MWPVLSSTRINGTVAASTATSAAGLTIVYVCAILSTATVAATLIANSLTYLVQIVATSLLGLIVLASYIDALITFLKRTFFSSPINEDDRTTNDLLKNDIIDDNVVTNEVSVLAAHHGLEYEEHNVSTGDGHVLVIHRVFDPAATNSDSFVPVLCVHGVLQRAGVFIAGSKRSLAVILAKKGYDVWLMNSRAVFPMHKHYSPSSHEFWDWSVDELGYYDVPAAVSHVRNSTGGKRVVYVGHSQGAAEAFVALHEHPELSNHLQLLVGLAPAVFAHPPPRWVVKHLLAPLSASTIQFLFGKGCFIPVMLVVQKYVSATLFANLAYAVFNYLFGWTDTLWQRWRAPTYFQFTPGAVSSRLVGHWMENLRNGRICKLRNAATKAPTTENYGVENVHCPVAIFHGGEDNIVSSELLVKELNEKVPGKLVHFSSLPGYTHMDVIWAKDAPQKVFNPIADLIRITSSAPQTSVVS